MRLTTTIPPTAGGDRRFVRRIHDVGTDEHLDADVEGQRLYLATCRPHLQTSMIVDNTGRHQP